MFSVRHEGVREKKGSEAEVAGEYFGKKEEGVLRP